MFVWSFLFRFVVNVFREVFFGCCDFIFYVLIFVCMCGWKYVLNVRYNNWLVKIF